MKIGERGQVTIPKDLREKYGLFPSIEVEFVAEREGIRIQKKTNHLSPVRQVYGLLGKVASTDEYLEEIRGK
ncbi:MAG: AbrB/MazE/SpoVT family DNA-binding domain-containing protein [Deltaproteobacteria bacterium]|nr:AbrB/MazE/SpoVT family DNA-binding domain-containing protein [Deltaproteobacteria bacterium]